MQGMTLKQFALAEFLRALEEYEAARDSQDNGRFVRASLAIHQALGGVPKSYKKLVTRVWREAR